MRLCVFEGDGEMKKLILIVLLTLAGVANGAVVNIFDVQISPVGPSDLDIITIEIDGGFTGGGNTFDYSVFSPDEFSLELDLYFTGGFGPAIPQSWSHDEEIDTLALGSYDLSVQAFWRNSPAYDYVFHDDYFTNFEVVPEPATILLFGMGAVAIWRKSRRIGL